MLLLKFFRNRDAGIAPTMALVALPLFASVGAAIDFSRAASARSSMQAALDASAIMLAKDAKNVDASQLGANADKYFNSNFHVSDVADLKTEATASSTSGGYAVTMSATGSVKTMFMGVMGFSRLSLAARAAAMSYSDGLGCVLSLDRHVSGATTGQGSTVVTLNGCSLYDNSDNPTALAVGGSASISALSVGVVGGVSGEANITATQGIKTGGGIVEDPYANASFPNFSSCTEQNFSAKDTVTIEPGVYCGGMNVNAGAVVTLNPGIYYFDGGNLSVNGGATMMGDGVTLVFTSKNRNGFATASINGNATISLKPPKLGSTAGIVIFGDRRIPASTEFKFNGGSTQYLGGAVYVPSASISYSGGSGTSTNCTQLIGNTITFTGNSAIALNCKNYGTKPFSPPIVKITS